MKQNTTQVHNVAPNELVEAILSGVDKKISALVDSLNKKETSEYITRDEASKLLGVSLVSVHSWTRKGILKAYKIGNRVRYKKAEIIATLES